MLFYFISTSSAIKNQILTILIITSLILLSNCNFGVEPDLSGLFGGGLWGYFPQNMDSIHYSSQEMPSAIYALADSIVTDNDSSATIYFFAVADTTVVLKSISGKLEHIEIVNGKMINTGVDFNIANINTKNCLQDSSIESDFNSLEMKKDEIYNFCFTLAGLEQDTYYYLNGYVYCYFLPNEEKVIDSAEFTYEFEL